MPEGLPALLTVEEAAELLRIGRTKAYAMAKQWRQSGGAFGLPVIDLGDVLRVPLARLESMTGADFAETNVLGATTTAKEPAPREQSLSRSSDQVAVASVKQDAAVRRRSRKAGSDQLDLFVASSASD
ncbi:MAG TPA: helix-turn-helix domain-containing protein [Acidimicrobiales bacterium]|nr:helix-turn-helix domain-containing protein [Acidimicrobiales bacterium]